MVSFEVIEHIERYFDYLENVSLLLKENGQFLLSTPNRLQTFTWNTQWNPCHFQEFSPYQLRRILGWYFTRVRLIAQGIRDEATERGHPAGICVQKGLEGSRPRYPDGAQDLA